MTTGRRYNMLRSWEELPGEEAVQEVSAVWRCLQGYVTALARHGKGL
jgi:hypothetical protein